MNTRSPDPRLTAIALNCTLKRGDASSSTDKLLGEVLAALAGHGVAGDIHRVANLAIAPGVSSDEGEGDEWPPLRDKILAADILVLGTPIWLGQPSSVAKRVLERLPRRDRRARSDASLRQGSRRRCGG